MQTTLKALTYDIRNLAANFGIVDDDRLSFKQVKDWINKYRALLIRRDLDKGKSISSHITQDLGCIPIIRVDSAECCDLTSDCGISRTSMKIPVPVELSYSDAIQYVGNVNKKMGYELSSQVGSYWDEFNKYTKDVPKWYLANGYVYITNEENLRFINVRGIFQDPTEAGNFSTCAGDPCYTDMFDYPINDHMVPTIKQMIIQQELRIGLSTQPDQKNDANESQIQQPPR